MEHSLDLYGGIFKYRPSNIATCPDKAFGCGDARLFIEVAYSNPKTKQHIKSVLWGGFPRVRTLLQLRCPDQKNITIETYRLEKNSQGEPELSTVIFKSVRAKAEADPAAVATLLSLRDLGDELPDAEISLPLAEIVSIIDKAAARQKRLDQMPENYWDGPVPKMKEKIKVQ